MRCSTAFTAKAVLQEAVQYRELMLHGGAGQVSKAFCCLADDHPAAQQACASAIPTVVSFLSLPDAAVREQACQALACLTCNCHQNQITAGQHGAVELLLHLLWTPCEGQQQQHQVVQLLLALLVVAVQVGTLMLLHLAVLHAHMPMQLCSALLQQHALQCVFGSALCS